VKLLDFGVSALVGEETDATGRRTFIGSRRYASPEQLDGQPATTATDIYALGLIMFEMLTFTLPHDRLNESLTVAETALNARRMGLPPQGHWRADMDPGLERVVRACLAYEPAQRPEALQLAGILRVKRAIEQGLLGSA
jgi:eukaryotic-like serine/threonine-protein kinase